MDSGQHKRFSGGQRPFQKCGSDVVTARGMKFSTNLEDVIFRSSDQAFEAPEFCCTS
jgi:hypothetical protein